VLEPGTGANGADAEVEERATGTAGVRPSVGGPSSGVTPRPRQQRRRKRR
jgi:hypothetical protein